MTTNQHIADELALIASLQEIRGDNRFRVLSTQKAARIIGQMTEDVAALADDKKSLTAIDGIGDGTADKIIELVKTGKITEKDELLAEVPEGLIELLGVSGLGPKTIRSAWKQLGVTCLADLKGAIEDGSLASLPRMGDKAVQKIRKSLEFAERSSGRLHIGRALPLAERIVAELSRDKAIEQIAFAGSLRRGRETIGDIDILVAASKPERVTKAFSSLDGVEETIASGETKTSVRMSVDGDHGIKGSGPETVVQVDLRIVPEGSWGAALLYFTGSKDHNVLLRERALARGMTLNEYGLFPEDDHEDPPQKRGVEPIACGTEQGIYEALGLPWIPPEMREDRGELEIDPPPALIEVDDIKAELHAHTTASDGSMSIEELAERAKSRGFHTIAVTDHSKSAVQANGLSVDRLLEHIDAVRQADSKVKGITILAGCEVDILSDGSLDYEDRVLERLDLVVASPHVALSQDPEDATRRLVRAIEHPLVHILGHPTGRLINRREGLSPDMGKLIKAAVEHDTALEINAHPMRLDLRDTHVRAAVEAGALISINCDDHIPADFDNLRFGVLTARRGWLTPKHCINTWGKDKLGEWIKSKR